MLTVQEAREVRASCFSPQGWEYCDIAPWLQELGLRIQEAQAAKTNIVNISYTHPRGLFPPQIRRRAPILAYMKQAQAIGWYFDSSSSPGTPYSNLYFLPTGWGAEILVNGTLDWCPTAPFEQEIERRVMEAQAVSPIPVIDLTCYHERGGISPVILKRIERRRDPKWRELVDAEITRLRGEANKDEAFAKTQEERAEGVDNPTALLQAAKELRARAAQSREQVRHLARELGVSEAA
jgi:hypothetical protein